MKKAHAPQRLPLNYESPNEKENAMRKGKTKVAGKRGALVDGVDLRRAHWDTKEAR